MRAIFLLGVVIGWLMVTDGCRASRSLQSRTFQTTKDSLRKDSMLWELSTVDGLEDCQVWEILRTEYFPIPSKRDQTDTTPAPKQITQIKGITRKTTRHAQRQREATVQAVQLHEATSAVDTTQTLRRSFDWRILLAVSALGGLLLWFLYRRMR